MKVRLAIYTMITLAPILSQMASSTQETTDAARKLTMESKQNALCSACKGLNSEIWSKISIFNFQFKILKQKILFIHCI